MVGKCSRTQASGPQVHSNPVNWRDATFWLVVCVLGTVFGIVLIALDNQLEKLGIIAPLLSASVFAGIFYLVCARTEIRKPSSVEITDSGVVVHKRLSRRTVFVQWEDIMGINVFLGDEKAIRKNSWLRDATLYLNDERSYVIHRPIALAVREKYKEHMGRYPMHGYPGNLTP